MASSSRNIDAESMSSSSLSSSVFCQSRSSSRPSSADSDVTNSSDRSGSTSSTASSSSSSSLSSSLSSKASHQRKRDVASATHTRTPASVAVPPSSSTFAPSLSPIAKVEIVNTRTNNPARVPAERESRAVPSPNNASSLSTGASVGGEGNGPNNNSSDCNSINTQAATRRIAMNPTLRFERRDNEYIPLPPLRDVQNMSSILRRTMTDRSRYPEGRYRMLDYFRAAVEMFITQVRTEFSQQHLMAQRHGRLFNRFTWKNTGELAICFACCCDMLKLLYDLIQPGPLKPTWDSFAHQLFPLLIGESAVPPTILTSQTYQTKYMDWQKGGTRYTGEQSNVRFPSAQERRSKIETYLRTGAGYHLQPVIVDSTASTFPAAMLASSSEASQQQQLSSSETSANTSLATKTAGPFIPAFVGVKKMGRPGATVTSSSSFSCSTATTPASLLQQLQQHETGSAAVLNTVRLPAVRPHAPASSTTASNEAFSSTKHTGDDSNTVTHAIPEELRHLQWLSTLAHIKGGSSEVAFPDQRAQTMPGYVRLCEITEIPEEMLTLARIMVASSEAMQILFERIGGVIALRRFASLLIQAREGRSLIELMELVVRLRMPGWGTNSQQAWRTDMSQRVTGDLNWLRTASLVPVEKRAAWGALIFVLEQKFLFRPPRDSTAASYKRDRSDSTATETMASELSALHGCSSAVRAAAMDNFDIQRWKLPRVNTLFAVRLPYELRAPPLASELEKDTIDFLNAKRDYATHIQQLWQERLQHSLQAHQVNAKSVCVPVWYDPYQLLGVNTL